MDKIREAYEVAAVEVATILDDGTVVLQPRVLVSPNALTAETLRDAEAGRDVQVFETADALFEDLES